ncbi:hypothetical protein MalM25_33890 [Planctomycetes bacterium MalM25]|nr:hypothetical protein MalM25_33890 [Planctomycetes bacterium MalM25]
MSVRYLLPCPCGKPAPVSASQAGGVVTCPACGETLETPRLRDLVQLPTEEAQTPPKSGWSPRQGVLTAGLLLAAALAGGGGWFAANEPQPPAPFDPSARSALVEKGLEQMSATDLWKTYHAFYQPMMQHGLQSSETHLDRNTKEAIRMSHLYQRTLFFAAAAVAVAAGAIYCVLPK